MLAQRLGHGDVKRRLRAAFEHQRRTGIQRGGEDALHQACAALQVVDDHRDTLLAPVACRSSPGGCRRQLLLDAAEMVALRSGNRCRLGERLS